LSNIGGISSKGLTIKPRLGNDVPRVAECDAGMLNSVGLQNPGIEYFIEHELPHMLSYGCVVIANIAGHQFEEYADMAKLLDKTHVDAIELNLSCPNVSSGCMAFGSDASMIRAVTESVKTVTNKPVWVKLTPNVTSVSEMALAAQDGGADAVSLINTLLGMVIDIETRRPVDIPVIGMGGIMNAADALEFMIAGACAVQVGTANLVIPTACNDIVISMEKWAQNHEVEEISSLTGSLRRW
jgi:dihydroorotate dehydrogenase (NAD+) catalytic subunit